MQTQENIQVFYLKVKMLPILNPFEKLSFMLLNYLVFLENSFKPINKLALREKLLKPFLEK